MSAKPAALNLALQRFVDEQYAITVRDQHLLVHDVPYVAADRTVKRGTLACTFITNADVAQPPDSHQAWFSGEFPCYPDGKEIVALGLDKQVRELFPGFVTNAWFSNKPPNGFADHYTKMTHYIRVISDQARAVEAEVDARTGKDPVIYANDPVFRYPDSASARGEYLATSERLRLKKLAIIGLGGTGGYVLDQVAKTPVTEVHLFDGDEFLEHNAFRAPGAARAEELAQRMQKVAYFKQRYDPMRQGIIEHPYYVTADNIAELQDFEFVFLCVDKGPMRALIGGYLRERSIPFIDCGMFVQVDPASQSLFGTCRVTLMTADHNGHWEGKVPLGEDAEDENLYDKSVQVADMNAMNALLAVMKWKQIYGFYRDDFKPHQILFSVSSPSLTRSELGGTSP